MSSSQPTADPPAIQDPVEPDLSQLTEDEQLELESLLAENERRYYYRTNPVNYFVERLGVTRETIDWSVLPEYRNHTWDGTPNPLVAVLNALAEWRWVGVEGATGAGKTFLAAGIMLWFLETWPNSLVITTATKESQLKVNLWKEAEKLHGKFGRGDFKSLLLRMKPPAEEWSARGFVSGIRAGEVSSTRTQGFHAEHMLIICEETPGIPEAIMTALQNTCQSKHNLILALGNPDHQMDQLHKFVVQPNVVKVRVSAYDHPNVVCRRNIVPGAVTSEGLVRLRSRYGSEDNPLYLSRGRGICPAQSEDSLIRLEWCYAARDRANDAKALETIGRGRTCLAVDVANSEGGDKAAIAEGPTGGRLVKVVDFQCPSSNQLGHKVALRMRQDHIKAEEVAVDGVGVGAGSVNILKEEYGLNVETLTGGCVDRPGETEQFVSLRAQMWWKMREDLRLGRVVLPDDEELFADLVTPKWGVRSSKIWIEDKLEIKKRLGRSPNKGDASVYWNWIRETKRAVGAVSDDTKSDRRPRATGRIAKDPNISRLMAERRRTW